MAEKTIEIKDLVVEYRTRSGVVQALNGLSLSIEKGKTLGLVGETGAGKTTAGLAVLGLIPSPPGVIVSGEILLNGKDLRALTDKEMDQIRGDAVAMIFQDPMTFLNPVVKIGKQITEVIKNHQKVTDAEARARAIELMGQVGIPSPEKRLNQYPHEFSGGMRQRIIIAIALANNPKLIIADEPTTALDVTIQAQVLDLIRDMKEKMNSSVIMITHDLGVVASLCDRILIMYGGKIVESGSDREIFYDPKHPYTRGLLQCVHNPEKKEKLKPIAGSPPDLLKPPAGCPFVDRCPEAMKVCKLYMPEVTTYSATHQCACWLEEANRRKGENHG